MTESRKLFPFVLSSVLCLNLLGPVHENSLNTKYFLDSFLDFHDSVKESCAATLGQDIHERLSLMNSLTNQQIGNFFHDFKVFARQVMLMDSLILRVARKCCCCVPLLEDALHSRLVGSKFICVWLFQWKSTWDLDRRDGVRSSCSPKVFLFLFCFWHEFSLKLAFEN